MTFYDNLKYHKDKIQMLKQAQEHRQTRKASGIQIVENYTAGSIESIQVKDGLKTARNPRNEITLNITESSIGESNVLLDLGQETPIDRLSPT